MSQPDPPIPGGKRRSTQFEENRERAVRIREELGVLHGEASRQGYDRERNDQIERLVGELSDLEELGHGDGSRRGRP